MPTTTSNAHSANGAIAGTIPLVLEHRRSCHHPALEYEASAVLAHVDGLIAKNRVRHAMADAS